MVESTNSEKPEAFQVGTLPSEDQRVKDLIYNYTFQMHMEYLIPEKERPIEIKGSGGLCYIYDKNDKPYVIGVTAVHNLIAGRYLIFGQEESMTELNSFFANKVWIEINK